MGHRGSRTPPSPAPLSRKLPAAPRRPAQVPLKGGDGGALPGAAAAEAEEGLGPVAAVAPPPSRGHASRPAPRASTAPGPPRAGLGAGGAAGRERRDGLGARPPEVPLTQHCVDRGLSAGRAGGVVRGGERPLGPRGWFQPWAQDLGVPRLPRE